jgi:hypothetical protein
VTSSVFAAVAPLGEPDLVIARDGRAARGYPESTRTKEDLMATSQSTTTTEHEEIRRWVEQRNGRPSSVKGTGGGDDPGILRIDLPGGAGEESLEHISWDEWFEKFDEQRLAAILQERKADGEPSTFIKLVSRDGD